MKKAMTVLGVMVVVMIIFLGGYIENHYNRHATVTDINNKVVTVADSTDNEWMFFAESENDYYVGQNVTLKMDTNGTDSIYDDFIVSVK